MTSPYLPAPGTIGLTQISGDVGKLIRLGQWLNGDGFADYEHAFIYLGGGQIMEAEPGGALISPLSRYKDVYWCEGIAALAAPDELSQIAVHARTQAGCPYSFLDYLSLALHRFRLRLPALKSYIASTRHMICSQLADWCYDIDDVHIFTDGRWPGDVTPADLLNRDRELLAAASR